VASRRFELYANFSKATPNDARGVLNRIGAELQLELVRYMHTILDFKSRAEFCQIADNAIEHRIFIQDDFSALKRSASEACSTVAHFVSHKSNSDPTR